MDKDLIIKKLKSFKKKISKQIKIDKMIFFGSLANNKGHKYSDVDLLIISPEFKEQRYVKRPIPIYKEWDLNLPVDILCYTPKEIKERINV